MIVIDVQTELQFEDVLVKVKHKGQLSKATDMFHCSFHTGFIDDSLMLRLPKAELDKGYKNKRIPDGLYVDLIFERHTERKSKTKDATSLWKAFLQKRQQQLRKPAKGYVAPFADSKGKSDTQVSLISKFPEMTLLKPQATGSASSGSSSPIRPTSLHSPTQTSPAQTYQSGSKTTSTSSDTSITIVDTTDSKVSTSSSLSASSTSQSCAKSRSPRYGRRLSAFTPRSALHHANAGSPAVTRRFSAFVSHKGSSDNLTIRQKLQTKADLLPGAEISKTGLLKTLKCFHPL